MLTLFLTAALSAEQPPNVVLLLVDDLGWSDLGCYGSTYHRTPQIDTLAARGVRFTQAYAACPVCSPTRASVLTGRHPVRVGITDWIPGMAAGRVENARFEHVKDRDNLALDEVTIAELLGEAGYARWFLGKWHLGDVGHYPTDQGFEVNIGGNHRGSPPGGYYAPWTNPTLAAKRKGEYLTDRLTDEAIGLMTHHVHASPGQPFFMQLCYYNVHTPITANRERVDEYADPTDETPTETERNATTRLRQDNPAYASMVQAVDDSVGRLMESLDNLLLTENTVVVFFSDNGGLATSRRMGPTSNAPLRAGKGWLYEGGIREPLIFAGPSIAPAVSDQVASSCDLAPTILELAGQPPRPALHRDGQSLVPTLRGEGPTSRTLHWHYPHYHGSLWRPGAAIRDGDWKLIEHYEEDMTELFDLSVDPGERRDLAAANPTRTADLKTKLREWQTRLRATMPVEKAGQSRTAVQP